MSPGVLQKRKRQPPSPEKKREYNARYAASAKGKAKRRKSNKAWRDAHRDYFAQRKAEVIAKKICCDCMGKPTRGTGRRCQGCQDKQCRREQAKRMASGRPWRESQKQRDRIEEMRELSWLRWSRKAL